VNAGSASDPDAIDRRPAANVGDDVGQFVVREIDEFGRRHRRRLPSVADAVADGPIPIGGGEPSGHAAVAAGQVRRRPIADHHLIDEHATAEIGAMAAVAPDARLDEVLTSRYRPRQRR
jgi:hypothetical protein